MAIYFPAPLAVPIVYFSSENNGQPWARISPDLELIDVPGGHYDWVTIRAQRLARRLLPRIQGARAMAQVTNIRELPLLHQWDVFDGLHARGDRRNPGGWRPADPAASCRRRRPSCIRSAFLRSCPRRYISRRHMDQDRAGHTGHDQKLVTRSIRTLESLLITALLGLILQLVRS